MLSGLRLKKHFARDNFARLAGIELIEVDSGYAQASMAITPEHLNAQGLVHGGAIFTLADFVFAVASNSHGSIALAINASISFTKAVKEGVLIAEARETSRSHKLATYQVKVIDERGDMVAQFQGTVYRKEDKLSDR